MSFAFDLTWKVGSIRADSLPEYFRHLAAHEFGDEHSASIGQAWYDLDRLVALRKQDHIDPDTFILLKYYEADVVVGRWKRLVQDAKRIYSHMDRAHQSAFFQLVLHPIKASYICTRLRVTQYRNQLFAKQRRNTTNMLFHRCLRLLDKDHALTEEVPRARQGPMEPLPPAAALRVRAYGGAAVAEHDRGALLRADRLIVRSETPAPTWRARPASSSSPPCPTCCLTPTSSPSTRRCWPPRPTSSASPNSAPCARRPACSTWPAVASTTRPPLLRALDDGRIAVAGLDVFTSEPPPAGSTAARLAAHPRVVATPHLGASTVEVQENVSLDVCTQVLDILRGGLPTSAVNAPIILPEEYRKLQPSVQLVEKMGRLYTQHFVHDKRSMVGGRRFELVYHGDLAAIANTKPLFAALVKGLVAAFSDSNVNMVNAALIAREKGIVINETHARTSQDTAYSNLITLRSVGGERVFISKLDRFSAAFSPEGTLIILHSYDEPGKIGGVGTVLGSQGINIRFMQVASLGDEAAAAAGDREALMILGVDGDVAADVLDGLRQADGVLDVSLVRL